MVSHLLNVRKDDHTLGSPDARIVLIEYGDFQCPYCKQAEGPLRSLRDAYDNELLFVFRHFPLSEIHEWAELAAVSSEAAGQQGKFWEMHDFLFGIQDELGPDTIARAVDSVGLDIQRFAKDLQATRCRERVEKDLDDADELGLDGTPSLFFNGEPFREAVDFNSMSRVVAGIIRVKAA
jgi:protein-disulfide isomerase